jgi:hypothetical protein
MDEAARAAECWAAKGLQEAMNRFNSKPAPTAPGNATNSKE